MEAQRFDALAREMGASRRSLLVGGLAAILGLARAADVEGKKKGRKHRRRHHPAPPDGCTPACAGKACGDDGCGGSCGSCPTGQRCQAGDCQCAPACAGKACGPDGCGGQCGTCPSGQSCASGACRCVPNCAGKACGSNGCGGSCGSCSGSATCVNGACRCTPDCAGKRCGSDGCGGSCGSCPTGQTCAGGSCQCASGCGCGAGQHTVGTECWPDSEERAFLTLINNYRTANGRAALAMQDQLGAAAELHAQEEAAYGYSSHTGRDGSTPNQRIERQGYDWSWWGENIYYGFGTQNGTDLGSAQAAFTWWKNSPDHNANMLSSHFTQIGIGRAYRSANKTWYWTTDFGSPG